MISLFGNGKKGMGNEVRVQAALLRDLSGSAGGDDSARELQARDAKSSLIITYCILLQPIIYYSDHFLQLGLISAESYRWYVPTKTVLKAIVVFCETL